MPLRPSWRAAILIVAHVRPMMSRLTSLSISLALLLVAFPLVSVGTASGPPVLWLIGLGGIAIGAILPPLRRFTTPSQPPPEPTKIGLPEDDKVS